MTFCTASVAGSLRCSATSWAAWLSSSVKGCAAHLKVPFAEVKVEDFTDPYQVPRVLKTLLEAPVPAGGGVAQSGWVEKVMKTPVLVPPAR